MRLAGFSASGTPGASARLRSRSTPAASCHAVCSASVAEVMIAAAFC